MKSLYFMTLVTFAGHDIVASFIVRKPVSLLQDNILQLADDIFEEIGVPSTKVPLTLTNFLICILSMYTY